MAAGTSELSISNLTTTSLEVLSRRAQSSSPPGRASSYSNQPLKVLHPSARNHLTAAGTSELGVAGALGFEPRLSVLETDVLPLTPCPSATDIPVWSLEGSWLGSALRQNTYFTSL